MAYSNPVPGTGAPTRTPRSTLFQGSFGTVATPPVVTEPVRAVEVQQVYRGSRTVFIVTAGPVVYNDSAAGTVTLSGTATESFSTPPIEIAQAVVQPQQIRRELQSRTVVVPAVTFQDSASGTITLSGIATDSFAVVPPVVYEPPVQPKLAARELGSRTYPQAAPTQTFNDSASGTITLSGSASESFSVPSNHSIRPVGAGDVFQRTPRSISTQGLFASGGYALPPVTPPAVQVQGQTNQNYTTQQPGTVPAQAPKDPQPQVFVYYNAAPPVYSYLFAGSSNQWYTFEQYQPAATPQVQLGSRLFRVTPANVFNDSASGTITLSGTASEGFSTPSEITRPIVQPATFTRDLGPRIFQSIAAPIIYTDAASGTITLSGSSLEAFSTPPRQTRPVLQPTYTLRELGSRTLTVPFPANTFNDSSTGNVTLAGLSAESFSTPPPKVFQATTQPRLVVRELTSRTAGVPKFFGTTFTDSGSGQVTFTGAGLETQTQTGAGTVTIVINGTAQESSSSDALPAATRRTRVHGGTGETHAPGSSGRTRTDGGTGETHFA